MVSRAWKYVALALVVAVIGSNALWLYNTIDVGITRSYQEQTAEECEKSAAQLEVIANHYVEGRSLAEVRPFIFSTAAPDEVFQKPEEHLWWVGNIALVMKDETTVEALTTSPYER